MRPIPVVLTVIGSIPLAFLLAGILSAYLRFFMLVGHHRTCGLGHLQARGSSVEVRLTEIGVRVCRDVGQGAEIPSRERGRGMARATRRAGAAQSGEAVPEDAGLRFAATAGSQLFRATSGVFAAPLLDVGVAA